MLFSITHLSQREHRPIRQRGTLSRWRAEPEPEDQHHQHKNCAGCNDASAVRHQTETLKHYGNEINKLPTPDLKDCCAVEKVGFARYALTYVFRSRLLSR